MAIAVAGCGGSTRTKTIVRTVTRIVSTPATTAASTTTTSTAATAPCSQATSTTTSSASTGPVPALNGTYALAQTNHDDDINLIKLGGALSGNPHDGILSDNTIEGLVLFAPNATGNYTGNMAGTLGDAECGVPIKERMIVRVGGIQQVNGQQIATRLTGVITAYYQCPGSSTTNVVATYTGTRT